MTTAEQIEQVERLRGNALRDKFREVTGVETRSNNRPYLIRRIVDALQAGGRGTDSAPDEPAPAAAAAPKAKTARASRKATKAGPATAKRARDPRLPHVGAVLEREHDGKTVRVKVTEDGFDFRGKTYRSLSAIAREATGTSWNGLLFFHVIPYAKREK